jgi:hypothetical protein
LDPLAVEKRERREESRRDEEETRDREYEATLNDTDELLARLNATLASNSDPSWPHDRIQELVDIYSECIELIPRLIGMKKTDTTDRREALDRAMKNMRDVAEYHDTWPKHGDQEHGDFSSNDEDDENDNDGDSSLKAGGGGLSRERKKGRYFKEKGELRRLRESLLTSVKSVTFGVHKVRRKMEEFTQGGKADASTNKEGEDEDDRQLWQGVSEGDDLEEMLQEEMEMVSWAISNIGRLKKRKSYL